MSHSRRDVLRLAALSAALTSLPVMRGAVAAASPPAKKLKILILGGTGFTGPFQVNYALARGHEVTLFNRGKRPSPEWSGSVEQLHGDRETGDLKSLEGRHWDVCIDNPTSVPHWVRDAGKVLAGKVQHYLFISTISVYAEPSKAGIDESSPLAPYKGKDAFAETRTSLLADVENLYGPLKALSEIEAEKQFPGRTTIVRPGYIVGPRDESDRFTYWALRIAAGGEILVPGDGHDPVQIIDGRDLAEWMIRLAEQRVIGTFNACGPDYELSTDAMMHGIHAVTGGKASFTHVPLTFIEAQGDAAEAGFPIWSPDVGEYAGFGKIDITAALQSGLNFRRFATTVAELLSWYRSLPADRQSQLRAGMKREQELAILKAWQASGDHG